jgi:hypothetical protein
VTVTNTSPGNIPLFIKLDKGCEGFGLPGVRGKHHLRPGSSLTIPVSFAAGTAGFYECVLDMGNQVPVVPLSAFVMHPDAGFALDPENLEFPEVVIDETATINLKITNTGLTTYTLEPALSGATEVFALRNDLTGYVIPPGGFVFLTVDFTPTAAAGYDAQLYLAYDLPRPLVSGVGVEPILACSMAPASLEFGPIAPGESQTLSLTITNTGNVVLDVSPSIDDPNFSLAGSGASLAPGQALTVPVTFAPLSVGTFTTTIDPGTETCDPVPCVGETTEGGDPTQDNVGFFFDEAMSLTRTTTTAPNEVVMGYLALVNPSNTSGVAGWECWLEMTGNALMLSSVLEGDAINIGGGTQFIVGIGVEPLPYAAEVLLASFQVFVMGPPEETVSIALHPTFAPSLPGLMSWLSWDDVNTLKPMFPLGGHSVVALINEAPAAPGEKSGVPALATRIVDNAPNPFNPSTRIKFELGREGQVMLAVFDVTGRRVKTLHQGHLGAGPHAVVWQGQDDAGRRVASGVYYLRMVTEQGVHHRKMMLLK